MRTKPTRCIITHWQPGNYKESHSSRTFYTEHHARQYIRALSANKTPYHIDVKWPDALLPFIN